MAAIAGSDPDLVLPRRGSEHRPFRIFTRSTDTPHVSRGFSNASSRVPEARHRWPAAPGLYWIADDICP